MVHREFCIQKVRSDFPVLSRKNRGKSLVFLDNAATTQKPSFVIDGISEYYRSYNSNVHRGVYELAEDAENLYHKARKLICKRFNATLDQTIFVRGATEGLNLIAQSFGPQVLSKGDEIIVTEMEHHANIVPWQIVCKKLGVNILVCPTLPNGSLDISWLSQNIRKDAVKLIAVTAVSNTLGTVNPIEMIVSEAKRFGVRTVIDGAQCVPHQKFDFENIGCDFFTFSGHKLYGPMGIGVVFGRSESLAIMPPYQGGGDMIDEVSFEGTTFAAPPQRFEAGTPNVAGAIGLGKAVEYLDQFDIEQISDHEKNLYRIASTGLNEISGFNEYGTTHDKEAVLSFTIDGIHPHDLATFLDAQGIAIRTGHHCCQPLMKSLGVDATARASFSMYNTENESELFVEAVKKAVDILK
jgi:cysteine desulfurase/selenocysteine lyase